MTQKESAGYIWASQIPIISPFGHAYLMSEGREKERERGVGVCVNIWEFILSRFAHCWSISYPTTLETPRGHVESINALSWKTV